MKRLRAALRNGLGGVAHRAVFKFSSELQHAADSRYCVVCGHPYEFLAAYVGHLGDYRCPACGHSRPALQVVAREIELRGLDGTSFELVTPQGSTSVRLPLPGIPEGTVVGLAMGVGPVLPDPKVGLGTAGPLTRVPLDV